LTVGQSLSTRPETRLLVALALAAAVDTVAAVVVVVVVVVDVENAGKPAA
jgi:hypothetical protein